MRPMFQILSWSFQTAADDVGKVVRARRAKRATTGCVEAGAYRDFFLLPFDPSDWNPECAVEDGNKCMHSSLIKCSPQSCA